MSILFGALVCAISHGQMAGMQLSGLDASFCTLEAGFGAHADLGDSGSNVSNAMGGSGCAIASVFGAILLAAFFGLLGLLGAELKRPLPPLLAFRLSRDRWPPANPRASPFQVFEI
ncbi:hypothetical protein GCM10009304_11570 [Pseudomonas matsuisoli]|uniref:DUF2946 domain-containing protein n=2 Tax=Pseudomonas matsuisoli TaxID=1515666 RepID=A0A917PQD5_9PSED|nr:hypothetical protein GCM10009304_11570 [Pseudomonas matsuisoli]